MSDGAVDHEDGIESVQVEKQVSPGAQPCCLLLPATQGRGVILLLG